MRQIIESKNQYFERVFRDKDGRLVRATFQVYESAGRIKARLVNFVYLTAGEISGKVSTILGIVSKKIKDVLSVLNFELSTLNFEISNIYTIGSKPRAPTFI
ncbi:MAG: hypothetical protein WAW92_04775 [Minisyncoccia bacterium]